MRIAFLLTQDLESPSGLGRYWPLAKELSRLGNDVEIIALHSNYAALSPSERDFDRDGVQVRYVAQMHVRKFGNHKQYFKLTSLLWIILKSTGALLFHALKANADVYHICKPHPMNGLAGLIASCVYRRPLYLDCDDYEAVSNRVNGRWQKKGIVFFEELLPKLVRGITTNTHFSQARLETKGGSDKRIVYVPNGVDRFRFSGIIADEYKRLREQLGLTNKKVILYVGSLSLTSHPVDLLLEAFCIVRQHESRAILLLVGGGEDYEHLNQLVYENGLEEAVRFTGRVKPEVIPLYYHLADISVDPVVDDLIARARYPLKVVESLACGTPVVTGDVGDRKEILGNGKCGVLVEPGIARALAEGLLKVLQSPTLRSQLASAALACRERLYWDCLVHNFASIYTGF